ncbi:MAG: glycosyltransferase [Elusimicrobia bacterium]|nr:glycosyltransferase [Elusimicrobiota bacterium]
MPRVSVVVPAWNAEAFLEKTLETVAAQTFRDFELIVVDDGSRDGTKKAADRFLERAGLEGRCLRQENRKIAGARNAGIRAARGELVAFLDHDDLWLATKLAEVAAEFDAHPETDLVGHHENVVRDGRLVRISRCGPYAENMYERLLFEGNALSPSATTVRRDKLIEAGLFRENPEFDTVEDYDLWLRLAKTCRMRFLDRVLGEYQLVERAASNRIAYHNANLESLLRDHFRSFPDPDARTRALMRRRLAAMNRSAARGLLAQGDAAAAGPYARRAASGWPWDWRNAATWTLWAVKKLGGRAWT